MAGFQLSTNGRFWVSTEEADKTGARTVNIQAAGRILRAFYLHSPALGGDDALSGPR